MGVFRCRSEPRREEIVRTLLTLLACLLMASTAAAQHVQGCVTPKAKTLPNGSLDRQFINIYFHKSEKGGVYVKIAAPLSLYVAAEEGAWLKVTGSPSSPFKPGEELGVSHLLHTR
jgi:hypothetical protein